MSLFQKVTKFTSDQPTKLNNTVNIPASKLPLTLDAQIYPALKFISKRKTISQRELSDELHLPSERATKIINDLISIGVITDMDEKSYDRNAWINHKVLIRDSETFLKENFLIKELIDKAEALRKYGEKEEISEYQSILSKYRNYIEKFCELAYREVKALDEWGDENSGALAKLKAECIRRIAKQIYKEVFEKNEYSAEKWLEELYEYDLVYDMDENKLKTVRNDAPLWVRNLFLKDLPSAFEEYCRKKNNLPLKIDEDFNGFSGKEFEIYISNLLIKAGFNVSGTPTTGDQGADLIATKDNKTYVMQLKRNLSNVGNKAIQEAVAAKNYYDGDFAVVLTNSLFTQSAKNLSRKNKVILIDKISLPNFLALLG